MNYGKQKVKTTRRVEVEIRAKLKTLEETLDRNPDTLNEDINHEINETKSRLEEIENYKIEGLIMRSRCQWFEKGEKSNDYFLRLEKRNRIKKNMSRLQRPDGSITTDPKEILVLQKHFYETLYTSEKEKNYRRNQSVPRSN